MTPTNTLVHELCDLTPVELDAYVFGAKYLTPGFYGAQMFASDMRQLADHILQNESLGDALARIEKVRGN